MNDTYDYRNKVDAPTVKKYIREVSLNDKFRGTWVAEGLTDEVTKGSLAKSIKQKDLIDEILIADGQGDEWLEEQRQSENLAHNYREPPIEFGVYFNAFANRNLMSYRDYKHRGIKEMAKSEIKRFDKKVKLQDEARRRGIKHEDMLNFINKMNKEEHIRKIVPKELLRELKKRERSELIKKGQ